MSVFVRQFKFVCYFKIDFEFQDQRANGYFEWSSNSTPHALGIGGEEINLWEINRFVDENNGYLVEFDWAMLEVRNNAVADDSLNVSYNDADMISFYGAFSSNIFGPSKMLHLYFFDDSGTLLQSGDMPTNSSPYSEFGHRFGSIDYDNFQITSLTTVPLPAGIYLFLSGLVGLGLMRGRNS